MSAFVDRLLEHLLVVIIGATGSDALLQRGFEISDAEVSAEAVYIHRLEGAIRSEWVRIEKALDCDAVGPELGAAAIHVDFLIDPSFIRDRLDEVNADEFEAFKLLAEGISAAARALKLVRERITLCRRDIAKMITTGIEEGVPTRRGGHGPDDWAAVHGLYRAIVVRIPRTATLAQIEPLAEELTVLADEILNLLEMHGGSSLLAFGSFAI